MPDHPNRIVIVGGGFAGATLAQHAERDLPAGTEIVVLSSDDHQVFTPMLPEVVGRTISPMDVVVPGRQLTKRAKWLEASVDRIDRDASEVHYVLRDGTAGCLGYSHLALACGSAVNLDEIPGVASRGYPLKSVIDAIVMGNDLIGNFEAAVTEPEPEVRRRLLTVVIIGGGFSGVEVAGSIVDLMHSLRRYYPELKEIPPRIVLLQKGELLIPELNQKRLSDFTLKRLRKSGVEVLLGTSAEKADSTAVHLTSGEHIQTAMIVCTVGTSTQPLIKNLGLQMQKGRLSTESDMRVIGISNVWALGDCSLIENAFDGKPSPATAQFAIQQSKQLAHNLRRTLRGEPTKPFRYRALGMLASIGHRNGVALVLGVKLSGFIAWFLWRGVYLAKLPTLSRKLEVAVGWAFGIPFPPNIVQIRLPAAQASGAGCSCSRDDSH